MCSLVIQLHPPLLYLFLPPPLGSTATTCRICCRQTLQPELWCPPDWTAAMVAGATARTISVTIVSPIEMVRTKMQSEQLSYKGKYW